MNSGFYFDELSNYKKELLTEVNDVFPKETRKFLTKEAQKLTKKMQNKAETEVKHGAKKTIIKRNGKKREVNYHKCFKKGKIYIKDKDICIRAYNNAPHGHLIENGHYIVARGEGSKKGIKRKSGADGKHIGWVSGKKIIEKSYIEFQNEFSGDMESFLFDELNKK